jgi:hypothetical protein
MNDFVFILILSSASKRMDVFDSGNKIFAGWCGTRFRRFSFPSFLTFMDSLVGLFSVWAMDSFLVFAFSAAINSR